MNSDIEISIGQLVDFLRRGLLLALALAALFAVGAYYLVDQQPDRFRASATAYAAERGLDLAAFGLPQLTSSTLHVDTYRAALLSDPLLAAALEQVGATPSAEAIKALRSNLTVRTEEVPRLIHLEVVSGSATDAAATATAVMDALVEWDRRRAGGNLDRVVDTLEQQVVTLEARIAQLENDPSPIAQIQRNARTELLTQQQDRLNTALALQVSVAGLVEVVQPASIPGSRFSPNPRLLAIVAALFGLLLGYGVVYVRNVLQNSLRDLEELVAVASLPILATYPKVRRRNRTVLREAASFLRTNILHLTQGDTPPVVLVTSATAAQGKTTVAATLAESLARNGYRTLLVDCDLRNPSIGKFLRMRGTSHLTVLESLNRNAGLRNPSTVEVGGETKLHVLPGGKPIAQAAELLGSNFEYALDRWRAGYQAIVIDSPPALAVADSLIMARHCSGSVVVVNAENSDRRQVRTTIEMLNRSKNRLLGVVATHVAGRALVSYGYQGVGDLPTTRDRGRPKPSGEPRDPVH